MQSYVIVDESILLISVKSAIVVLGPVNQKKHHILDKFCVVAYQNDHEDEPNQDFIRKF